MPAFSIRLLTADDLPLMEAMMTMFGEAFGDMRTYTAARPGRPWLTRLLARRHFIALAALQDGAVVGGIAAYQLDKFEQERSEIYLYDLAVAAPRRRQGIATALMAALRRLAAERGAYVVFVQADRDDAAAIALYGRLGVREDVLHFDIAVPGDRLTPA